MINIVNSQVAILLPISDWDLRPNAPMGSSLFNALEYQRSMEDFDLDPETGENYSINFLLAYLDAHVCLKCIFEDKGILNYGFYC